MTRKTFIQRLQDPTPLLADGAMGTLLLERGDLIPNTCLDALNLAQPELVQGVHSDYVQAGSDLIETNTFGANRYKLAEYGHADQVAEINQRAVELARSATQQVARDVYVAGAVGPLGIRLKPYGRLSRDEAGEAFAEQIGALVEAGVDLILLETFADDEELLVAVEAARRTGDIPIVAQATFSTDGTTYNGHAPATVAHELYRAGVQVLGVNCGSGPNQLANLLQAMARAVPGLMLSAMPNAGYPEAVGGRVVYPAKADYFGQYARTFQSIGARIVGGCCGTTPAHIAAMRQALDDPAPVAPVIQIIEAAESEADRAAGMGPTRLARRLAEGRFTVTVEVAPPRSYSADKVLSSVRLLRDAGSDVIDIADTPAARMRMSAWALAHLVQDHIGIDTVLHFPTRGRNILRVQGDLLAAHALGLRNLFITMGDPPHIGDFPNANDGYDIVPSKLIALVKHNMNEGHDMAGHSIGQPTQFTVGCALNMAADDLDREIKVLGNKLEAGADFALGQAVFDPPRIEAFIKRYREITSEDFNLPVLMGVMPLYSLRHAQFLHNEVPGIIIPDSIFSRLEKAGEDDAPREGVGIAIELIRQMRDWVQGAYIIPAFHRYSLAAQVCDGIVNAPAQA